jgi:hypothetical protein
MWVVVLIAAFCLVCEVADAAREHKAKHTYPYHYESPRQ